MVDTTQFSRDECLKLLIDHAWEALHTQDVSWIGVYCDHANEPDDRRLMLGPSCDKPACSPIGLHGACGQCLLSGETLIVHDVKDLDENYVACDPRDQSELVMPLRDSVGKVDAVLDLDSFSIGAFSQRDAANLGRALTMIGLR